MARNYALLGIEACAALRSSARRQLHGSVQHRYRAGACGMPARRHGWHGRGGAEDRAAAKRARRKLARSIAPAVCSLHLNRRRRGGEGSEK